MAEKLPDHFGVDFGNHSVKAVELRDLSSPNPRLISFGSKATPFGVLNSDNDIHIKRLAEVLKDLTKEANIKSKYVVIALPESVVSTRVTTIKGVKEKELNQAVYWDTKQSIPVPIDEMELSWMVLSEKKDEEEYLILRVAATKKIIKTYTEIVTQAGFEPLALETEGIAIARMVKNISKLDSVVVLDFGSQTTDMSIVKNGALAFSQSITTGSDALTRAIMSDFSLEYSQSEEYKRKYGLEKGQLEDKIFVSLDPVMKIIVGEVVRGIEFYKSQTGFSAPKEVSLVGDGSLLPGLVLYLTEKLGVNISLSDPWKNIKVKKEDAKLLSKGKSAYAVAVGLALRQYMI